MMNRRGGKGEVSQGGVEGELSGAGAHWSWPGRPAAVAAMEGIEREKGSRERSTEKRE